MISVSFRTISKYGIQNRLLLKPGIKIPKIFPVSHLHTISKSGVILPMRLAVYRPNSLLCGFRYNTTQIQKDSTEVQKNTTEVQKNTTQIQKNTTHAQRVQRVDPTYIDQVAIEEDKPKIPIKKRIRNSYTKHKRRWRSYLLIGTSLITTSVVIVQGWKIIGDYSGITLDSDGLPLISNTSIEQTSVAYGVGIGSTIVMLIAGYAVSRFLVLQPQKAYRQLKRDILASPLVRSEMGGNVKIRGFQAYSVENGGFQVFGANEHDDAWKKWWKTRRVNMMFQIQSAGGLPNYTNPTVPNSVGMVSACFHLNLANDVWYDYVVLDTLSTGSRVVLWGDTAEKYEITYCGYTLTSDREMIASEKEEQEEQEEQKIQQEGQPNLLGGEPNAPKDAPSGFM